jgi:hypothetical protein
VTLDGRPVLGPLGATVWRALTDNDGTVGGPAWQLGRAGNWHAWGLDHLGAQWQSPQVERLEDEVDASQRVRASGRLVSPTGAGRVDWARTVTVGLDGVVRVDERFVVPDAG